MGLSHIKINQNKLFFIIVLLLVAYFVLLSVLNFPSIMMIRSDSRTWLSLSSTTVLPYFGQAARFFEYITLQYGAPPTFGYFLYNALQFYGGICFVGIAITRVTKFPLAGPLSVLLVCAADSLSVNNFIVLTEASSIGIIFWCIGILIFAVYSNKAYWWVAVGTIAAFGISYRGALAFLIPLALVSLIIVRPGVRSSIATVTALMVSWFVFMVAIPWAMNQTQPAQLGRLIITQAYHLQDQPDQMSEQTRKLLLELNQYREDRPNGAYRDVFRYDQKMLSPVSKAASQWAKLKVPRDGYTDGTAAHVNRVLSKAAFEIIAENPISYLVHFVRHGIYSVFHDGPIFKRDWYFPQFDRLQKHNLIPLEKFAKIVDREDVKNAYETIPLRGIQLGEPLLFDLTDKLINKKLYNIVYITMIITSILSVFSAVFYKLPKKIAVLSIVSSAGIGYLLTASATTPVIARYVLPAEGIILIFLAVLLAICVNLLFNISLKIKELVFDR